MEDFQELWYDDEELETNTSREQCACEKACAEFLLCFDKYEGTILPGLRTSNIINGENEIRLMRDLHAVYLKKGLLGLPGGFVSLDASRPWLCYWILHALYLLKREPVHLYPSVVSFLSHCQNQCGSGAGVGGFGGGPTQLSHCAPTYAAVLALCTIGTHEAFSMIHRAKMYAFFISLKDDCTGTFCMHRDGETDTRSMYTVISVARLLNILTPKLVDGCAEYLAACQTYEGGFGGEPGNEAHGGYNFCALATLLILERTDCIDLDAQEAWIQQRQVRLEGGFQGRTNKTVDSCYSFWQGAALALVNIIRSGGTDTTDLESYLASPAVAVNPAPVSSDCDVDFDLDLDESVQISPISDQGGTLPFNQKALQRYILHCGQNVDAGQGGGMRDKPGKSRDYYHSCYALSGLSISQSFSVSQGTRKETKSKDSNEAGFFAQEKRGGKKSAQVFGDVSNLLEPTSAVFNIGLPKLHQALTFFENLPKLSHEQLLEQAKK